MREIELVVLNRDTAAIVIPEGETVQLPKGTHVRITQSLGGAYTVMTDFGQMLRIDARNADALGKEPPAEAEADDSEAKTLEDRIWAQLKTCFDPEIPVNIVDLGLVYNCEIVDAEEDAGEAAEAGGGNGAGGGKVVDIQMTLTAPGCGMGDVIADDVKRKVEGLAEVEKARVDLVFDPPWNQNMMSEAAKLELGMF